MPDESNRNDVMTKKGFAKFVFGVIIVIGGFGLLALIASAFCFDHC